MTLSSFRQVRPRRTLTRFWLASSCLFLLSAVACGGGSSSGGGGTGGMAGGGNDTGGSDGSGGMGGGNDGTGGTDGTGGAMQPMGQRPGMGLVSGGVRAESANFVGVFTLGEAPGGNRVMQSAQYRLDAGVVGTTQQD